MASFQLTLFASLLLLIFQCVQAAPPTPTPSASPSAPPPAHAVVNPDWRLFGPLPLGGVGADALSALPGSLFATLSTIAKFPSETARGGFATWSNSTRNETTGQVTAFFNGSAPPLIAWAVGSIRVIPAPASPSGEIGASVTFFALRCTHPAYVLAHSADGTSGPDVVHHCTGTEAPCPLSLPAGIHAVYVQMFAWGPNAKFKCEVDRDIPAPALVPMPGTVRPAAVVHEGVLRLAGAHAAVVVQNADPAHWAVAGTVQVSSEPAGINLAADSLHPPRLAPGQTRAVRLDLDDSGIAGAAPRPGTKIKVRVLVEYEVGSEKRNATFKFAVKVFSWPPEVYDATYIEADSSVQAVALRPPLKACASGGLPSQTSGCSALLSTHGAGVDALGNAWTGAYATQRGAWVILPTGRSPYGENWEGAQLVSALRCLQSVGERMPGVPDSERARFRIRKDWVLFSGHSMGGHGALKLSTSFPDLMVAAMPISGWLRYETYGRVGDAFHEQLSFSDAGQRAIFDLSVAEYATDLYSENVLGIPFIARVGSADQNVPPTNLRKFCRLVREYELYNNISSSFVTLNEVPGKGHWFSGVMDDGTLQPYLDRALSSTAKPALPSSFSLFTINPSTTGSRGGLRVMQLHTPFESARITVRMAAGDVATWALKTRNIHRFRYRGINGVHPRPERLLIDDNSHALPIPHSLYGNNDTTANYIDFCASGPRNALKGSLTWSICEERKFPSPDSLIRGPDTSGPLTQVISGRRVAVIYPAGDKELLGIAVRYANSLHRRGIGASITPDTAAADLMRSGLANLVVLGGADMNTVAQELQNVGRSAAVRTSAGRICVGERCTERPGAGIAFLAPGQRRSLVAVIAGTDRRGLLSAASFMPRSPEQKIPEWVLVQSRDGYGWRGYGAVESCGYFNMAWEVEIGKTYPSGWVVTEQKSVSRRPTRVVLVLGLVAVAIAIARVSAGLCKNVSRAAGDGERRDSSKARWSSASSEHRPFLSADHSGESGVQ